jgi:hypothetical protein
MSGPREELRHTFVSLLSANDVNLEDIARLVGHAQNPELLVLYGPKGELMHVRAGRRPA